MSQPRRFRRFDRNRLHLKPLEQRRHDLSLSSLLDPQRLAPAVIRPEVRQVATQIVEAKRREASVILLMGAHVIRAGVSRLIISLMEQGLLSHVAMNGAGPIHDFEFALIGATTESVADYVSQGQFGLWNETGRLNEIVIEGATRGLGFGEAVGQAIFEGPFPHKSDSILAAGYRLGIPVTVHVGIGYDIIHEHPSCSGAATGSASYDDFLIFADSVSRLEGGVLMNFGSAVMGPEIYLKALAMARNVAHQEGRTIQRFTTAVFDLAELSEERSTEPVRDDPKYYFRPLKTILIRTVKDGGHGFYIRGDHRETFPELYLALQQVSSAG